MSTRLKVIRGFGLALLLGWSAGLFAAKQEANKPAPPPPPTTHASPAAQTAQPAPEAKAAEETPSCSECHDQAKVFDSNVHAFGSGKNGVVANDVCTPCHGDGTEHIQNGGDKTKISVPRGVTGANETCLLCHQTATDKVSRRGGMHSNSSAVNCLSCHSIHSSKSEHLVAAPQLQLCGNCHTQAASFKNKPYAHRLDRGGMECSTCHEPHGRPGKDSIRTTASGDSVCVGCHTDKRGPFVFKHGAMAAGECATCHEPHGSMNNKQLTRANVSQVCLECHSTIGTETFAGQPPAFHNISTARFQNCTTCHAAIHGSNRDPQLLK